MTKYSPGTGTTTKTKATHEIHNTSNITELTQLRQDKAELLEAAQRMVDAYACTGPSCRRCELIAVLAKAGKGA